VTSFGWRAEGGYLFPADEGDALYAGIGVDLNEEAALAYPHEDHEPPHWRRPDGSVNDW
jgi:hypothetical protein